MGVLDKKNIRQLLNVCVAVRNSGLQNRNSKARLGLIVSLEPSANGASTWPFFEFFVMPLLLEGTERPLP